VKHLPTKTRICAVFWCEAEPQNSRLSLEKCERISAERSPALPGVEKCEKNEAERQPSGAPTLGPCRSETNLMLRLSVGI